MADHWLPDTEQGAVEIALDRRTSPCQASCRAIGLGDLGRQTSQESLSL